MSFIAFALSAYSWVLIGAVLVSWLPVSRDSPLIQALDAVTEPVLAPIRKLMPDMGGLDLSPIVALLLIRVIQVTLVS